MPRVDDKYRMPIRCSRRRQTTPLVLSTGKLAKHTRRFRFWPIRSIMRKHDVIHQTEVAYTAYCTDVNAASEKDRAAATGNVQKIW